MFRELPPPPRMLAMQTAAVGIPKAAARKPSTPKSEPQTAGVMSAAANKVNARADRRLARISTSISFSMPREVQEPGPRQTPEKSA